MPLREIETNLEHWEKTILEASTFRELERLKADIIGKSGVVTSAFKLLKDAPVGEKKALGEKLNKVKSRVEEVIAQQRKKLENYAVAERLKSETLDITLPVENDHFGGLHIITQSLRRIRDYYSARGFLVLDGPEVETEFYNFDALNMPKHHPARQSHDTFYLKGHDGMLLRTQTSCVQIRAMQKYGIPLRMISIGKTYRNDQLDATHSPMFHQIEGLVVDTEPITIGHLKSELKKFLEFFFETDSASLRFRPSFFPFTEPGMEFDCRYTKKDGKLVISSDGDKWIELGGAGMVHPNVFKSCEIKDEAYGFAFGLGLERIIMLKYGITDIRNLYDTDQRWLRYYGTCA